MSEYGPDKPCQRTACAEGPAHLGGEHIDPRSARYDGPDITIGALDHGPRRAARALLAAGAPVAEVVDLVEEIHRLKRQVAAAQVDRDRGIREASRRALDCEAHGARLQELEGQVDHFARQSERNNRGRLALLGLPQALMDLSGLPTLDALRRAARKTLDAHQRAWK